MSIVLFFSLSEKNSYNYFIITCKINFNLRIEKKKRIVELLYKP